MMDSAALLDLLGNENRRRILRLLAQRPCYVTEISEYLDVSPKAVIDHLRKLEDAGLVESHVDDGQRKYFHIARNLRLEISVSPYGFGTRSAYPASRNLDITSFRYLSVDVDRDRPDEPTRLARRLNRLRGLENELSVLQRWVQGRITEIIEELTAELKNTEVNNGRLYADILVAVADGTWTVEELSRKLDVPPDLVADAIVMLSNQGIVEQTDRGWHLVD